MEALIEAVAAGAFDLAALAREVAALTPAQETALGAIIPTLGEFAAPITRPPKFFAIAINGRANWERSIKPEGATAQYFIKLRTCITGPGDPVEIPDIGSVGPEVELAVIIGKGGKHIPEDRALDHVFGYTIHNDLTAHDLRAQKSWIRLVRKDGSEEQLTYPGRWKNFDTFSPLGPWLVTPGEVPDPEALRMSAHLNGELVQEGSTAEFVFKVPQIITFLSQAHTLEPGDIISTGTVPAVAPWTMAGIHLRKYGGQISCEIEGLGQQINSIKAV
jgi:2-keto-4-pentenoate hydratase/2-oxohepta-3-ene-1,7-dioic acid hydratase in catechol pathway